MSDGHGFRSNKDIFNFPEDLVSELAKIMYPVGAIYMSTSNTNPGEFMKGTTWQQWGKGRVPIGVGAPDVGNTANVEGGPQPTDALTSVEIQSRHLPHAQVNIPAHYHGMNGIAIGEGNSGFLQLDENGDLSIKEVSTSTGQTTTLWHTNTSWQQKAPVSDDPDFRTIAIGVHHNENIAVTTKPTNDAARDLPMKTDFLGSGNKLTFSSLPPYVTCYMWKRTA